LPGFVDPSIHLMSGNIAGAGRLITLGQLARQGSTVLRSALHHGTTRAEVKIGGVTAAEELRLLRNTKRLNPNADDYVRTWLVRPALDETAEECVESRLQTFEYIKKKIPRIFLEVEVGENKLEAAAALFAVAAKYKLRCKLTWQGRADAAMLKGLAQFHLHALTLLDGMDSPLIPNLISSQMMLVVPGGHKEFRQQSQDLHLREFLDASGPVALTTGYDPARSPMFNMQMSIALAVWRMNLTTEEAITASTVNAAYASGIGTKTGSLEHGKSADLLLLNLADYRELPRQFGSNHVALVIREGAVVFNRIGWKPSREGNRFLP
jgi:imidazolonepropionase